MRTEQQMLDVILSTARADERVRAVIMNGSRANPNAPRDFFQDFDIVYVVTDVASFLATPDWIDCFGERMILQTPEAMGDPPGRSDGRFGYLMQFMDGNRIDLGLYPLAKLADLPRDSQSILLLDKDGIIEPFPPASDKDYLPRPPTAKQFDDCCNEFWWVSPYVAKGLWRKEIAYAKYSYEHGVREQLEKMLVWYAGMKTGFTREAGKAGKYLDKLLEPELWARYLTTYSDGDYDHNWDALFASADLFRTVATRVAGHFGYKYPHKDDERVSAHLRHVRALPRDAKEMY
jgi:aminoglycoside 6-adenylyltransferase